MVAYYHSQCPWRAAYRSGAITKAAATKLRPGNSHAVDRGMSILQAVADSEISLPHTLRASESLRSASEAGFQLQRGTCTTSDFGEATATDLQTAVDAAEEGVESEVGFSVEMCYDADDIASIELLCNNCRGPGHMSRSCPSPKKYRSFAYVAELNLRALQRVETRARERDGPCTERKSSASTRTEATFPSRNTEKVPRLAPVPTVGFLPPTIRAKRARRGRVQRSVGDHSIVAA